MANGDFSFSKWWPSAILEFKIWKFYWLMGLREGGMHHHAQYTSPDEIKPVSIDHWPTVACQIWPR